ncbi:hypothetical protein I7I48_10964 [Histoplasma ohiense]|nr:hypothetical protein I7I48_10964 [Histoplasma ohiense (nom. inval.)]
MSGQQRCWREVKKERKLLKEHCVLHADYRSGKGINNNGNPYQLLRTEFFGTIPADTKLPRAGFP